MDRQCPSCGGFCQAGCKRANVPLSQTKPDEIVHNEVLITARILSVEKAHEFTEAEKDLLGIYTLRKAYERGFNHGYMSGHEHGYVEARTDRNADESV